MLFVGYRLSLPDLNVTCLFRITALSFHLTFNHPINRSPQTQIRLRTLSALLATGRAVRFLHPINQSPPIIQSPNHSITQSFNHPIIQPPNHSFTQSFNHSITTQPKNLSPSFAKIVYKMFNFNLWASILFQHQATPPAYRKSSASYHRGSYEFGCDGRPWG